jgi:hypothetical protein
VLACVCVHRGFPAIAQRYYRVWLHSGAVIDVAGVEGKVTITGVNHETGELAGDVLSGDGKAVLRRVLLSPGDNSFDFLRGMVTRKS